MQHFLKLAEGIDVQPLRLALFRQPGLWNQHRFRTSIPGSPHSAVEDILLRCQRLDGSIADHRESVNYPAFASLPDAYRLTMSLMALVQGERLGRVMLSRLTPGQGIAPHADVGDTPYHYERIPYWSRHHIVLQSDPAALFRCDREVVSMAAGECWAFRADLEHEVFWQGEGTEDRLHLIVDIHTAHNPVGRELPRLHHPHTVVAALEEPYAQHTG